MPAARGGLSAIVVGGVFVRAGRTPAALGLLADISERFPGDRGAIMGLYSVFLALGQILGSLIGGTAADLRGIDGILVATLLLLGVALIPLARLRRFEHMVMAGPEGQGGIDRPYAPAPRTTRGVPRPPRIARVGPRPALRGGVVRLGERAEHPVGHRSQAAAVLFESFRQPSSFIHRSHLLVWVRHSCDV